MSKSKIKTTCAGSKGYATCIEYETELPEYSEIDGCPSIEETTEELYREVTSLKYATDLSALGENCLTYVKEDGIILVKNVLLEYETKICDLEDRISSFEGKGVCEMNLTDCGLDYGELVTDCGEQPKNLGELLQILINK